MRSTDDIPAVERYPWWKAAFTVTPAFGLWLAVTYLFVGTLRQPPRLPDERLEAATRHLLGLRHAIKDEGAVSRMQQIFPEGGCFMITLYALSWTNLVAHFELDLELRGLALRETTWAVDQFDEPDVVGPFTDTQVSNGVFWLGQRNLVVGRLLEIMPRRERPPNLERGFHESSAELLEAFMERETAHLDAYPGQCWPTDNVTALTSLVVHDRLYGTDYQLAYQKWKAWTQHHSETQAGLPAGHLDSSSGTILQPPRGCANSWMLTLLPQIDPEYSSRLYERYSEDFLVTRLGFRVFREYPDGSGFVSDIDSGPILFGVGATATGVGLAASLANGDLRTAQDIHGITTTLGLRRTITTELGPGYQYLFGYLPIGDAFLTWAHTLPQAPHLTPPASLGRLLVERALVSTVFMVITGLLVTVTTLAWRRR